MSSTDGRRGHAQQRGVSVPAVWCAPIIAHCGSSVFAARKQRLASQFVVVSWLRQTHAQRTFHFTLLCRGRANLEPCRGMCIKP